MRHQKLLTNQTPWAPEIVRLNKDMLAISLGRFYCLLYRFAAAIGTRKAGLLMSMVPACDLICLPFIARGAKYVRFLFQHP